MTTSKHSDILHKQQSAAANEQFQIYKEFIVYEFVRKFGGSYQIPEQHAQTWRKTFDWTQEREEFLKNKTKDFLNLLPKDSNTYDSPKCLRVLTINIAQYLSVYICRQEEKNLKPGEYPNRNIYSDALFQFLFTDNKIVQLRIKRYTEHHNKKYAKMQAEKAEWEEKKQRKFKRKQFKKFAETGKISTYGIPLHTREQYHQLLIELYGSEKVIGD